MCRRSAQATPSLDSRADGFHGDTPGPVAFAIMEAGILIDLIKSRGGQASSNVRR
jgi:hypothetical protein